LKIASPPPPPLAPTSDAMYRKSLLARSRMSVACAKSTDGNSADRLFGSAYGDCARCAISGW
jgi:hypothetical protein